MTADDGVSGWIREYGRFCLSFVEGVDPAGVVARFGGEVVGRATRAEADELAHTARGGYRPTVRVGELGGWAVGVEHRPVAQGQRIEVLRRLSAGTRAVVVDFDGRNVRLRHVEDGDVIFGYDSLDADHRLGLEPDRYAADLVAAGLLPPDGDRPAHELAAAALDIAATITGVRVDAGLVAGRLVGGRVLPVLDDPAAVPFRWPVRVDPEVVARIAYATEEQLRPALVARARRRVAATGLDGWPEVRAALDEAAAGPTRQAAADSPLGLLLRRVVAEARAALDMPRDPADLDPAGGAERAERQARAAAARALHALLAGPPSAAAYEVLGTPDEFDDRDTLLAALAAVEPPPDAVTRLERHQEAQARRGTTLPLRFPRTRRS